MGRRGREIQREGTEQAKSWRNEGWLCRLLSLVSRVGM